MIFFFPPPGLRIRFCVRFSFSLNSLMPFRMAARQSPVALETAVIPPRPSGSASVAAQSRFCRSLKILKRGIDFSEMIDSMSLSIPEYSKSLTVVQEKLRNSLGHFKKSATQHLKYIPRNRLGLFDIAWSFVCVNSFNSSFVFA